MRGKRKAYIGVYARFPTYLFVEVLAEQWPRSRYVRCILGMNGRPVALALGEIERLMGEDGRHVPHGASVPLHRAFSAGDQVRVTAGAWRDWIVRLDAIDERGAQASVPILGRHAQAVLPLEWLEAA